MSTFEDRDFQNYELSDNVYDLAGGLLPDMAEVMGYDLGETPTEADLEGFIRHIGPAKWLQDNIAVVQERLATDDDATTLAANYVDDSGILLDTYRPFATYENVLEMPRNYDAAFITGGVARWMLRRAHELVSIGEDAGKWVGKVYVPVGNYEMRASEHDLVAAFAAREGRLPTQADFARAYIEPYLQVAGFATELVVSDSADGGDIMTTFAARAEVTNGTMLAVGNAPSAIQTAGQFRLAARAALPNYDFSGEQLYMTADSIAVARNGEGPATHQNPFTALGQIARNALFIHRNN